MSFIVDCSKQMQSLSRNLIVSRHLIVSGVRLKFGALYVLDLITIEENRLCAETAGLLCFLPLVFRPHLTWQLAEVLFLIP